MCVCVCVCVCVCMYVCIYVCTHKYIYINIYIIYIYLYIERERERTFLVSFTTIDLYNKVISDIFSYCSFFKMYLENNFFFEKKGVNSFFNFKILPRFGTFIKVLSQLLKWEFFFQGQGKISRMIMYFCMCVMDSSCWRNNPIILFFWFYPSFVIKYA